ncbi:MAG: hypothetical protein B6I36_02225 [Desulfobacteraceae bacterium 4572_35.1]|nr:MAG: hypothetical protein B6I36_02225 [Desulfobacteraceae bacterium 4572_35.1]
MRSFAVTQIKATAVMAGLDEVKVIDKPLRSSITDPLPRIELEYLAEDLTFKSKRIAKFNSPDDPQKYRRVRKQRYREKLTLRVTVWADNKIWLESFVKAFLLALPNKVADGDNNLVTISASRAVRGGFESKAVEVFKKRSNALHINFIGMLCSDQDIPLITDVNLKDGVDYKEQS